MNLSDCTIAAQMMPQTAAIAAAARGWVPRRQREPMHPKPTFVAATT